MKFVFFRFQRTEKMDAVVKGLMGQYPHPRIFVLEPSLLQGPGQGQGLVINIADYCLVIMKS